MCLTLNLKYLYRFIRGACRQSAAVVIQTGIVLNPRAKECQYSYPHLIPHTVSIGPVKAAQNPGHPSHTIISSCPELEMT